MLNVMSAPTEWGSCYLAYGRTVWVNGEVGRTWRANRQTKRHIPECCGVLVGFTCAEKTRLWIESVTTPMALDSRSRMRFKLRDPGHQRFVDGAYKRTNGRQIYLGTWHTHPARTPCPSTVDLSDWGKCLRRNKGRPLVFAIVGIDEVRIFVHHENQFKPLKRVQEVSDVA